MQIIDITQQLFHCQVFPGDEAPAFRIQKNMDNGDLYNLSSFSMCCHNGTHVDAPAHFLADGATIDQISLQHFVGPCYVYRGEGEIAAEEAMHILKLADLAGAGERILLAGPVTVTEAAARVFAEKPLLLLGNESQTVGPQNAPMAVHLILLSSNVVLLQGVRLTDVQSGVYLLNAAPLNLGGLQGSPCRAWLMLE